MPWKYRERIDQNFIVAPLMYMLTLWTVVSAQEAGTRGNGCLVDLGTGAYDTCRIELSSPRNTVDRHILDLHIAQRHGAQPHLFPVTQLILDQPVNIVTLHVGHG